MLDETTPDTTPEVTENNNEAQTAEVEAPAARVKKTAAKKTAAKKTAAKKTTAAKTATVKKATAAKKAVAAPVESDAQGDAPIEPAPADAAEAAPAKKTAAKKAAAKKTAAKKTTAAKTTAAKKTAAKKTAAAPAADAEALPLDLPAEAATDAEQPAEKPATRSRRAAAPAAVLFQAPDATVAAPRTRNRKPVAAAEETAVEEVAAEAVADAAETSTETTDETAEQRPPRNRQGGGQGRGGQGNRGGGQKKAADRPADTEAKDADDAEADASTEAGNESDENEDGTDNGSGSAARRRRRRGGRRRRKPGEANDSGDAGESDGDDESAPAAAAAGSDEGDDNEQGEGGTTRRRRVRVRDGEGRQGGGQNDDPNTVTRVRPSRTGEDQITSISGSTRLEAKKQRRRDGREAGRRRAPIVSEAEFLARREAVDRVMAIRQRDDLTQIAVLEDKVLVEHYVARESQTSLIGNVYVGRVQNVLPSMEAAFIDIGKGRNAVLYAGEVNWSALGHRDGQPRKIESVLSSGQAVLVQVTKDPVGHKGARLTSQVSLAGRFLVYVPDGTTSGISRKLPDTERNRLKTLLKEIVPDTAGVIVRTAAEGASEDELTRDVEVLKARWEEIEKQSKIGNAPKLLYGEPDLTLKVVRDLFTEDFAKLVIQGDDAWNTVQQYVAHVAPDLEERLEKYDADGDLFADYRVSEQIAKGLDRKVWLPSGGSLVIDRTEAMTVVDVNTGKFTGSGGNLEETVTKNNLEAAEEVVRQLRLRDIGGIIVVDFIDMVLESNRDLVLRRLVECLGRDRTRHQVAEVTSLGLVQMTRKRIGTGLLEAFSETCEHCSGSGHLTHDMPIEPKRTDDGGGERRSGNRRNRGRGGNEGNQGDNQADSQGGPESKASTPTPKDIAQAHPAPVVPEYPDEVPAHVLKARAEAAEKVAEAEQKAAARDAEARDSRAATDERPTAGAERPNRNRNRNRNAGQSARAAEQPSEAPAVDALVETPAEAPAETEAAEAPAAVAPVETPVDEAPVVEAPVEVAAPVDTSPKVVTRTRRTASRPAGSTAGISLEPVAIVVAAPVVTADTVPVAAPEPPRVVTRTRRAATRPAGAGASQPAPMTIDEVLPSAEAAVEAEAEAAAEHGEHPVELHVPIKKKGARKR